MGHSMKITDPDVIKNGEHDLIEAVKDDLDWDVVKEIIKNKMSTTALSSRGGQIVVHNNEIAFQINFDISLSGSLMFDRDGNYIVDNNNSKNEETAQVLPDKIEDDEDLDIDLSESDMDEPEDIEDLVDSDQENIDDFVDADQEESMDDDILDDDINDILQESKEFWEQKKDE